MPSSVFFGMQHLNNNLMVAIGCDESGPDPDLHELLEVCVVPVSNMLQVHPEIMLFNMSMKPDMPHNIDRKHCRKTIPEVAKLVNSGIPTMKVADYFVQWFENLQLPNRKKLIPLCHNYPICRDFMIKWLGWTTYHDIFHEDHRDLIVAANYLNDRADITGGSLIFTAHNNLRYIAKQLKVEAQEQGGSPCDDARTIIECYNKILRV